MKKLFYYNFNVGSGIEYTGNTILSWLKEIENIEIYEQKYQDQAPHIITEMIREKPDVIILNEIYHKSTDPTYYYKKFFPNTKVICIAHSYDALLVQFIDKGDKNDEEGVKVWFTTKFYRETVDDVITLNYTPKGVVFPEYFSGKVTSGWFPVDPTVFKPIVPWNERKKMFCYLGYTMPIKISFEFLKMVKEYKDLDIDFYTNVPEFVDDEYKKAVEESGLNINPLVSQDKVIDILNQYKYFVMPHGRYSEIFNVTLLQSILCGTIPLVCNDRTDQSFDFKWIDWANTFYFGCNKEKEFLENLVKTKNDNKDFSNISSDIVERARHKFDYEGLKTKFKNLIKKYVDEEN